MSFDTLLQSIKNFLAQLKQDAQLIPLVWNKPRLLGHWLKSAHKAQLALFIVAVIVPFALLPLVDSVLAFIFSPIEGTTLFGLINTTKDNPYLDTVQLITHVIIWVLSVLIFIGLFLSHLPFVINYAREMVEDKVAEADNLLKVNPAKSTLLYNAATQWNVDKTLEQTLHTKLGAIGDSVFGELDKTIAMAPQDANAPAQPTSMSSVIAERYPIKKMLGNGAMGNVYLAEDLRLKRELALKQLSPSLSTNTQASARFKQEAVSLARMSHPNIVQVYDFFEADGFYWIAMEFIKGGELEEKLNEAEPLELNETLHLVKQMAQALAYAHEQGVIHRDLKPANVLITESNDVKITDFGIAKLAQSTVLTQVSTVLGTPAYMSPEQANGEVADARTDIYSLGIIFYQLLAGELPFHGDTKSIIAQHIAKQVPPLSESNKDVPAEIDAIVQKMLAKSPEERFQSMQDLIEALDGVK